MKAGTVVDKSTDKQVSVKNAGLKVPPKGKGTTVLVYVIGSDLEADGAKNNKDNYYGAATMDIDEMMRANIDDSINLIVLTGGSTDWGISKVDKTEIDADNIQLYRVYKGRKELIGNVKNWVK